MAYDTAAGNDQASASSASPVTGNSQALASTQADSPQRESPAQAARTPSADSPASDSRPSADEWKRIQQELAESRREAAKYRSELKTHQDAQLTAEQKREREFADLQTKTQAQEQRLQRLHLENAGYRLGATLGIADISAALALIQVEHANAIKYDADGAPENLRDLLADVLKAHPSLAISQNGGASAGQQLAQSNPQRATASSGGVNNPGAGARGDIFTRDQIARMSVADYQANYKAIHEQIKRNGGRL